MASIKDNILNALDTGDEETIKKISSKLNSNVVKEVMMNEIEQETPNNVTDNSLIPSLNECLVIIREQKDIIKELISIIKENVNLK